jgi:hypothetical protein
MTVVVRSCGDVCGYIYIREIYYHRAFLGVLPSGQTASPAVATRGNPNKYGDYNAIRSVSNATA